MAFSWNRESGEWLRFFVQLHLPESGGEVQGGEDDGVGSADVTDAFSVEYSWSICQYASSGLAL